ncbi:glutathione S-transferase 4-like isoform X3 [Amblyomma americanum]
MAIILYNLVGSPPCGFIQSLAKAIGVELSVKNLDFLKKEHLTQEFLKINPFHTVPTIDDDGFIVYESNAIAYYLLRKYAPDSELYPACVRGRTRIDQVLASACCNIHPHMAAFFVPRYLASTKPTDEEVIAFEENVFKGLENLIGDKKFAVSDKITLADLCLTGHVTAALEINPFHAVPTIDDDGFILYESNAIAYYLLRKYAPDSELYPTCVKGRTRIDQVLASASCNIHPYMAAFYCPRFFDNTKPTEEELRAFEENVFKGLENVIGDGKYAVGDKITLADLCLTGHVTAALECGFVDKAKYPKLAGYYERIKSELLCFEEIYGPVIAVIDELLAKLK